MLLMLVLLPLLAAGPARADAGARISRLLEKARVAEQEKDLQRLLKATTRILALNPDQPDALAIRGMALIIASEQVSDPELARQLGVMGKEDLRRLLEVAPGHARAGLARDFTLEAAPLVPEPLVSCPASANQKYLEAEAYFGANRMVEAGAAFESALAGCPTQPVWWTHAGDVYFARSDLEGALARYDRAITLDPCYAPALRFKADALGAMGDRAGAHQSVAAAVACDPTYEAAWHDLRALSSASGLETHHHAASNQADFPQELRATYVALLAQGGAPMEARRRAVEGCLAQLPSVGDSLLWTRLFAAQEAGLLDAAIYVLMLDEDLAPAFLDYRVENRAELVRYVEEVLAPGV